MSRLFFPLDSFLIKNRTKFWLDLLPALLLAALIVGLCESLGTVNFFGAGGLLQNVMGLTGALTGFYIAALTAAATFQNTDLDHEIERGALYLREKKLTRREWICQMFGYLSFSAMAFTIIAAIGLPVANASKAGSWASFMSLPWISGLVQFALVWWLAHMFVVTNLGLYYLINRLSDITPVVTSTKPVADRS